MHYRQGELEGEVETFYKKRITAKRSYKENKLNGLAFIYVKSGAVSAEINYVDGEIHGSAVYYSSGQIVRKANYKKGEMHGKIQQFSLTQTLIHESTYNNGVLDGVTKIFSPDGMLVEIIFYSDGKKDEEESKKANDELNQNNAGKNNFVGKIGEIFRGE